MIYPPVNSMKLKQTTMTSTQQQISNRSVDEYGYPLYLDAENDPALSKAFVDVIDYYAALEAQSPKEAVFHAENDSIIPREDRMTAVFYEQEDGTWLTAYSPKPPTLEAIARAQFVDKTYVWKESSKAAKPS
jgi:hypothetical protein